MDLMPPESVVMRACLKEKQHAFSLTHHKLGCAFITPTSTTAKLFEGSLSGGRLLTIRSTSHELHSGFHRVRAHPLGEKVAVLLRVLRGRRIGGVGIQLLHEQGNFLVEGRYHDLEGSAERPVQGMYVSAFYNSFETSRM